MFFFIFTYSKYFKYTEYISKYTKIININVYKVSLFFKKTEYYIGYVLVIISKL